MSAFFPQVLDCLLQTQPDEKMLASTRLYQDWCEGKFKDEDLSSDEIVKFGEPGRPSKPTLVSPRQLPRRSVHTPDGKAALLHSFAHIEFNAINLALDAVYRFRGLPRTFYGDWLKIAAEEAYHFGMLQQLLVKMGHNYGDFDAHNGLWEMACRTEHDPLVRMAVIPRIMEARGLDVTPGIMEKFKAVGEQAVVETLQIILRDEIGHVECGSRWFHYLCDCAKLSRQETFEELLSQYVGERLKSPLHRSARLQAGFSEAELQFLEGME